MPLDVETHVGRGGEDSGEAGVGDSDKGGVSECDEGWREARTKGISVDTRNSLIVVKAVPLQSFRRQKESSPRPSKSASPPAHISQSLYNDRCSSAPRG